jgi:FtsH-binding integral membrane protein
METMTDPTLLPGQLPPIPEGCGILPMAENRIGRGPLPNPQPIPQPNPPPAAHSASSGTPAEDFAPLSAGSPRDPASDALEQLYRRVLARALALAACALLLASVAAASLVHNLALQQSFLGAQLLFRAVFLTQLLFLGLCSRYVEKLTMAPAALLLFAYAAFCGLEFSTLLPPAALAAAFLCAALTYGAAALWGFLARADLARPITGVFMMLAGGVILAAVNLLLRTSSFAWTLSSLAVVVFTLLAGAHSQQIRDLYQEFDDDNAEGWKASVLGALLLLLNSVNLYLLAASLRLLVTPDYERDSADNLPR